MSQEIWKDIFWYEWLYQVSNLGNVKSLGKWKTHNSKERILKFSFSTWWYQKIVLCKNWKVKDFKINRIVAQAFLWLDINDKYTLVCHKNDVRVDNRLENLFLWTHKDNMQDCVKKWRISKMYWERNHNSKLNLEKIQEIKLMLINWIKQYIIAERYWVNQSVISRIKNNNTWNFIN